MQSEDARVIISQPSIIQAITSFLLSDNGTARHITLKALSALVIYGEYILKIVPGQWRIANQETYAWS
jgi:hypothetical protein